MSDAGSTPSHLNELRARWELEPSSRVYLQLADEYRKLGQRDEAITVLERGLENRPNDLSGMVALGRCKLESGSVGESAKLLQTVIDRDPAHMVANKLLIEVHLQRGDADQARQRIDIYRLLNDRDPELDHLQYRLDNLASEVDPEDAGQAPVAEVSPQPVGADASVSDATVLLDEGELAQIEALGDSADDADDADDADGESAESGETDGQSSETAPVSPFDATIRIPAIQDDVADASVADASVADASVADESVADASVADASVAEGAAEGADIAAEAHDDRVARPEPESESVTESEVGVEVPAVATPPSPLADPFDLDSFAQPPIELAPLPSAAAASSKPDPEPTHAEIPVVAEIPAVAEIPDVTAPAPEGDPVAPVDVFAMPAPAASADPFAAPQVDADTHWQKIAAGGLFDLDGMVPLGGAKKAATPAPAPPAPAAVGPDSASIAEAEPVVPASAVDETPADAVIDTPVDESSVLAEDDETDEMPRPVGIFESIAPDVEESATDESTANPETEPVGVDAAASAETRDESAGTAPAEAAPAEAAPVETAPVETSTSAGPPVTATLGSLYLEQGHQDEAERIFQEVLGLDPDNLPARDGLSRIAGENDDEETAELPAATDAVEAVAEASEALTPEAHEEALQHRLLADPAIAGARGEGHTAKKVSLLTVYRDLIRRGRRKHVH